MGEMLTTKDVAKFLHVNEKMVYSLISEKGLPASKVTGKWLFPIDLVRQWVETGTENYPETAQLPPYHGLVLISGSNDLLLDRLISTFNLKHRDHLAMFGITGSMGGLKALRQNLCHIATSHLLADNKDYNFPYIKDEMVQAPAVVNLCLREQGLMVQKGNPHGLRSVADLKKKGVKVVNRMLGTGTRQLFDRELKQAGIRGETLSGYDNCVPRHMDVGISVLSGRAHTGPGIRAVANLLDLDFICLGWERFDLLIKKERFFDQGIQLFVSLLKGKMIQRAAEDFGGYDLTYTGKMIYPETEAATSHAVPETFSGE